MKPTPKQPSKSKRPSVNTYYMRKEKDNMWTAIRVKPDGTEQELNTMDLYHLAINILNSSILEDNGM